MDKKTACLFGAVCELMVVDKDFVKIVHDTYDLEAVAKDADDVLGESPEEELRQIYLDIVADLLAPYRK